MSFPPVRLDSTLHQLLKDDGVPDESLCNVKPTADNKIGSVLIVNDKYLLTSAQSDDAPTLAHLNLENCSHLLMFFAGPKNVIFVGCEDHTDDPSLSGEAIHKNAERSFGVIAEDQRPKVHTFRNVKDMQDRYKDQFPDEKIRFGFAMDFTEQLPCQFPPEVIYLLNSKRWLGASETMKSANDTIIDTEVECPHHHFPAPAVGKEEGATNAKTTPFWYYGGPDCKQCEQGMSREITRVIDILNHRPVPFVLKLNQSLSSVGTNIVVTQTDRPNVLKIVREHLEEYLPRVRKDSATLYPLTLIMSDLIDSDTFALNFYVRGGKHAGEVVFLGACEQLATGQGGRQTTMIRYSEQERMEKKFRPTLDKIGKAVASTGYYGAAGADVMVDPAGNQMVIDLNVRTALSHLLYLLEGHFNKERGYGMAVIYECLILKTSRDEFEKKLKTELEEAKIIIVGCAALGDSGPHAYGMVVAGKDKKDIDRVSEKIFELEA